ncbi:hypothetical protein Acsp05_15310 [Actinokineospora sp. NBRC 105648]|nr:hypothetical protein Acsp05_15310 [Actinokineospora sp. NBRC 105648]
MASATPPNHEANAQAALREMVPAAAMVHATLAKAAATRELAVAVAALAHAVCLRTADAVEAGGTTGSH